MPFFLPGRTTCAICGAPIEARWEAVVLPYVDPATLPSLARLSRRVVHRRCWAGWDAAHAYAGGAQELAMRGAGAAEPLRPIFSADGLIVARNEALGSDRLQDFRVPATIDLRPGQGDLVGFLRSALGGVARAGPCEVGPATWRAWPREDGVEFTVHADGEVVERFTVPAARRATWLRALDAIEAPG